MMKNTKLIYLINLFKAEFPQGFQSLEGYSREDFDDEALSMSCRAGLIKFAHYTATNKALLKPEGKKTVVDAVNILEGHWYFASESGLLSLDDESESFWCDKIGFNQCVTDLTGCPLKHAAWLAALNDMREGELKNSVHTGGNKTIDWQNGDQCVHKGGECFFVGMMPIQQKHYADGLDCFVQHKNGCPLIVNSSMLSKPESPEQKAEREREELTSEIFDELAGKPPIEVATYLADYELSGK